MVKTLLGLNPKYISLIRKRSFVFILFTSSLLGISINRFLLTWRFIEVNLLAFIPFISLEKKVNPHILGLKYFLTQSLGSIFLLVSYIYMGNSRIFLRLLFLLRIIWKIGLPPFHFWFFRLRIDLTWIIFLILNTWQKLLPLYILRKLQLQNWEWIVVLSLFVSVSGTLFQARIKKLIVFSSIFTGAWILVSIINYTYLWFFMLFIYRSLLIFFISVMGANKFELKERQNYFILNLNEKIIQFLTLLVIAGIPPFIGFYIKTIILVILLNTGFLNLLLILVLSSIAIIYIYSRLFLISLNILNTNNKILFNYKLSPFYFIYIFFLVFRSLIFIVL